MPLYSAAHCWFKVESILPALGGAPPGGSHSQKAALKRPQSKRWRARAYAVQSRSAWTAAALAPLLFWSRRRTGVQRTRREFAVALHELISDIRHMRDWKMAGLVLALFAPLWVANGAEPQTSDLRQTDIFVDGTDGYFAYRIPSLLVTKTGVLLAFCEGRKRNRADAGDIDLLLKRSTDGGKTWRAQTVVWEDGTNTCGNPCPVMDDATGTIWLFMTHNPGDAREARIARNPGAALRTVWLARSTDDGQTWSKPIELTKSVKLPKWGWYATGPGVGIQIRHGPRAGRLVIPCDHTYAADSREATNAFSRASHVIFSDDSGKAWRVGGAIGPQMNECQVVELADGNPDTSGLLINMRSYRGHGCRAQALSRDGGMTWSEAEDQPELPEPICQASLVRYTWPQPHGRSRILFSNPAHAKRRENLTLRLSYDEGKTWPVGKRLHAAFAAYSCLAALPDGDIACLYERGEKQTYEKITFARFTLNWLTDGKDTLK
jgi:sialidase-1